METATKSAVCRKIPEFLATEEIPSMHPASLPRLLFPKIQCTATLQPNPGIKFNENKKQNNKKNPPKTEK